MNQESGENGTTIVFMPKKFKRVILNLKHKTDLINQLSEMSLCETQTHKIILMKYQLYSMT